MLTIPQQMFLTKICLFKKKILSFISLAPCSFQAFLLPLAQFPPFVMLCKHALHFVIGLQRRKRVRHGVVGDARARAHTPTGQRSLCIGWQMRRHLRHCTGGGKLLDQLLWRAVIDLQCQTQGTYWPTLRMQILLPFLFNISFLSRLPFPRLFSQVCANECLNTIFESGGSCGS